MKTKIDFPFIVMPAEDGKGPKKLGDLNDNSLSEVETKILIPILNHHVIMNDKCKKETKIYDHCNPTSGLVYMFKCRSKADDLNNCYNKWNTDSDFIKDIKSMYLALRSEYRRTGIDAKLPFSDSKISAEVTIKQI